MALSVMTSVVWSLLTRDDWWAKQGFIFVSKVTNSCPPCSGFGDLGLWCRALTNSFISFSPSHEFVPTVESNDNCIDGIFWQIKHGFKGQGRTKVFSVKVVIFDQEGEDLSQSVFLSKLAETKIALKLSIIVMRHTMNKGEDLGGKCCLFWVSATLAKVTFLTWNNSRQFQVCLVQRRPTRWKDKIFWRGHIVSY